MTADQSPPDLDALLLQLRAVEYRATLSEPAFVQLAAAVRDGPPGQRTADFSQILYEVARDEQFTLPCVGHLVRALLHDDRLAEARLFCERWIELAPADADALEYRAVVACRMLEFPAADVAFRKLRDLGTENGVLWGINTMIVLSFSDGSKSAETAREMLEAGCDKGWALPLAAEAAFRTGDGDLIVRLARVAPELLTEPAPRPQIALPVLRSCLVGLLASRARP